MTHDPTDDRNTADGADSTDGSEPSNRSDGSVLDPDELDFTARDEVSDLGEDRFVVSAGSDGGPDVSPDRGNDGRAGERRRERPSSTAAGPDSPSKGRARRRDPDRRRGPDPGERRRSSAAEIDAEAVGRWLTDSMRHNGFDYGFDATLKTDGSVDRHRTTSTDAVSTFETLLLWYAKRIDDGRPVEETLGALLAASDVPVTYPTQTLGTVLRRHGLSRDDAVGDLIDAVERAGGVRLSTR
jgi:hypothetical protein